MKHVAPAVDDHMRSECKVRINIMHIPWNAKVSNPESMCDRYFGSASVSVQRQGENKDGTAHNAIGMWAEGEEVCACKSTTMHKKQEKMLIYGIKTIKKHDSIAFPCIEVTEDVGEKGTMKRERKKDRERK